LTHLGANLTAFLSLIAVMAIALFLSLKLTGTLRRKYPSTWDDLGRPQMFGMTIQNQQLTSLFLWRRQYLELKDPELTATCEKLRVLTVVGFVIFGAWAVWMALGGLQS
jgi:hypothetical protein